MEAIRLIVKYPNRRLYDLTESRYITLADIRTLVVSRTEVKITEKKSRRDITDRVLLQIISEQEEWDEPVLSRDFLLQTILSYGNPQRHGQRVPGTGSDAFRFPPVRQLSNSA
jgi:polyhydroxyalkanoate synthesis repressor PhaR